MGISGLGDEILQGDEDSVVCGRTNPAWALKVSRSWSSGQPVGGVARGWAGPGSREFSAWRRADGWRPESGGGPGNMGIPKRPIQTLGPSAQPTYSSGAGLWSCPRIPPPGRWGRAARVRWRSAILLQAPPPRESDNVEFYIIAYMLSTELCGALVRNARKQRLAGLIAPHKNHRDSRNASTSSVG